MRGSSPAPRVSATERPAEGSEWDGPSGCSQSDVMGHALAGAFVWCGKAFCTFWQVVRSAVMFLRGWPVTIWDTRGLPSVLPMNEKVIIPGAVEAIAPVSSSAQPVPHCETCRMFSCRSNAPGTLNVSAAATTGVEVVAYAFQFRCAESRTPLTIPVIWMPIPGKPFPSGSVAPGGLSGPLMGSLTEGSGGRLESGGSVEKSVGRYAWVTPAILYQRSSVTEQP